MQVVFNLLKTFISEACIVSLALNDGLESMRNTFFLNFTAIHAKPYGLDWSISSFPIILNIMDTFVRVMLYLYEIWLLS